jgi:hypothetical protein
MMQMFATAVISLFQRLRQPTLQDALFDSWSKTFEEEAEFQRLRSQQPPPPPRVGPAFNIAATPPRRVWPQRRG